MTPHLRWMRLLRVALASGVVAASATGCGERSGHDPFALMEGEGIYRVECASCHGVKLDGKVSGQPTAPALDASGQTWQRPRDQLAVVVKSGSPSATAPPADAAATHAFGSKLTNAQIDNVLAWIESQWPKEILKRRAELLPPK